MSGPQRSGVVVLAGVALLLAGRSWSEDKKSEDKKPAERPKGRVAVLNLTYVVNKYDKFTRFREELGDMLKDGATKDMVGKRQEKQIQELYADVEAAAARHAKDKDFDLILHYNDPDNEKEARKAQNLARRMSAGAAFPVYAAPGIDVSKEVLEALNKQYRKAKEKKD